MATGTMCANQKTGVIEVVPMEDGWWYDLRIGRNSITPDKPLKTRRAAIKHAEETARRFDIHVSKIEDMN
jgi:hypothetical protein